MTWIRTIPPDQAEGDLQGYYAKLFAMIPPEYHADVAAVQRSDGTSDDVSAAHSLFPRVMLHAMSTHGELFSTDLPLTRRQHEMIATLVSALNRCFY